jgi:electron transport complex protein RnfC
MPTDSTTTANRRLWGFHGGLDLPHNKQQSTRTPIRKAAIPQFLYLPLQQHIGAPALPLVNPGDQVAKGQQIARATDYVSAPLHAPTSGTVLEIRDCELPHPSGLSAPCIVIETDGLDRWTEDRAGIQNFSALEASQLRELVRRAGIVGMGGAAFPTGVKLNPGPEHRIDTLILNGAECEPYISCDDMLMRERADDIIAGLRVMRHMLQPQACLIGIEDNKPQAIKAMRDAVRRSDLTDTEVVTLPTLYPSGGEKQLIRILTGKEVPSSGLPSHIGILCHNVATVLAVGEAVLEGRPLVSRIVTVTGEGVARPGNLEVLIGTPVAELIDQCGGYTADAVRLIMGGPMMGFSLDTDRVPAIKSTNCLLVPSHREAPDPPQASPCIRCGACADVCPVSLLPQQLFWHASARNLDKAQDYDLFDCIECGCCAYVCPAHIPLVQYYRFAKNEAWAQEREKRLSDQARERHEARIARLERLKQEREARLRKKKGALRKEGVVDPKKAAIEAAMKRVAAKKAARDTTPRNTDQLTPAQQRQIEEVDARRRQGSVRGTTTDPNKPSEDEPRKP